eukprot:COSAG01_NODE_3586_length_5907_cov_7.984504_4_plen_115_part_00
MWPFKCFKEGTASAAAGARRRPGDGFARACLARHRSRAGGEAGAIQPDVHRGAHPWCEKLHAQLTETLERSTDKNAGFLAGDDLNSLLNLQMLSTVPIATGERLYRLLLPDTPS